MFLIFNLLRPNVLPLDDLGLVKAVSLNYFDGASMQSREGRAQIIALAAVVGAMAQRRDLVSVAQSRSGAGRILRAAMAKTTFLEFEQPIAELEAKIDELRFVQDDSAVDISEEIERLQKKSQTLIKDIYAKLSPWQVSQIARHPQRPYTLDYIGDIFTDFHELHGDRSFADDLSIIGGLARFNGQAVMVLGHQKGRDTKERALRNFGMSLPEGYRKALRLMKLAEKFGLPVFTFVDTPGAYPGIDAEERGQSEAIGHNLFEMSQLTVPIITTIIGEGGSGGALAIAVADQVLMLQYSTYSVISPEGCASILWKSADKAPEAAEALGLTAHRLKALGLIDKIVTEPLGGAHRDSKQMSALLKRALADALRQFSGMKPRELVAAPAYAASRLWPLQEHGRRKLIRSTACCSMQPRRRCAMRQPWRMPAEADETALRRRPPRPAAATAVVGYSGGRDSTALLHAMTRLARQRGSGLREADCGACPSWPEPACRRVAGALREARRSHRCALHCASRFGAARRPRARSRGPCRALSGARRCGRGNWRRVRLLRASSRRPHRDVPDPVDARRRSGGSGGISGSARAGRRWAVAAAPLHRHSARGDRALRGSACAGLRRGRQQR